MVQWDTIWWSGHLLLIDRANGPTVVADVCTYEALDLATCPMFAGQP